MIFFHFLLKSVTAHELVCVIIRETLKLSKGKDSLMLAIKCKTTLFLK